MLDMGIIKVELNLSELHQALEGFRRNRLKAFESLTREVRLAVSQMFNQLLSAEISLFLGKPDQTGNKRNGYEERSYLLKGIGGIQVRMPVDRKRQFQSLIIPPREQMDPRLKEDLALLHLAGISTRMLAMISKKILGFEISPATVSGSLASVEAKAIEWFERPLFKDYWALFVDGTNFRIQRRGSTEKEPSLVVLGIDRQNRMSILSIQSGQKDKAECWRVVFEDLKKRGLKTEAVQIGVMDGLPGLEKVFQESFPKSMTGRCWVHALKNALAKTPKRLSFSFKSLAHKIMYASSESQAREAFRSLKESMGNDALKAVQCLEKDLDSLLVHYRFEKDLWRTLKTTNPVERVNRELKRRTKTMESLGERTLQIVTAFVALRLEFNWQLFPRDSSHFKHLKWIKNQEIELTMDALTANSNEQKLMTH